jgi:hypothetical protein
VPSLEGWSFVLEAKGAAIAWTRAAVFPALRALGHGLVALFCQLDLNESSRGGTDLDASFATQRAASAMGDSDHRILQSRPAWTTFGNNL